MIVSYKWLQKYFKEKLPAPGAVAEAFTFGAFEVEGLEEVKSAEQGGVAGESDSALDLKVLPDRACYALSHRGIAYELGAILGQQMTAENGIDGANVPNANQNLEASSNEKVLVTVEDKKLCHRYMARSIRGVSVSASPEWLRGQLEAVGQRSINTIVDATNFVMLDMGQPLHAFDADKVKGGIVVRLAKKGETIELLPEKNSVIKSRNIELQTSDLIIADDAGPIAIAGVKGGLRAAVSESTKNVIIESANFDSVSVRKTSTRLALRNDASKRFENNLSVEFAEQAMGQVSTLIKKLCPQSAVGAVTDIFAKATKPTMIEVSADFISSKLGVEVSAQKLEEIFTRLSIAFEKKAGKGKKQSGDKDAYVLTVPSFRLDLTIPEDIVEEVGRIYGYVKIPPAIPAKVSKHAPINQTAYWIEKVKDVLFELGFSEVQTSSFALQGEVEVQNPLASDKKFLRLFLYENLQNALKQNAKNAALLGLDEVKIFEIGTTFGAEAERISLALGIEVVKNMKKKDEYIKQVIDTTFEAISKAIGHTIKITKPLGQKDPIVDIFWSDFIPKLKTPTEWDIKKFAGETKYKPFSIYPFMVRDVAVFVPSAVSQVEVSAVINSVAGPIKTRLDLFDVFTKKFENGEEKTSYAFHLVFQSNERTLVEDEVTAVMKKVSDALTAKSWQVR